MSAFILADTFGDMRNLIETAQWKVLGWGAACLAGTFTFLKLVANEVHDQKMELAAFEKTEMVKLKQQLEAQKAQEDEEDLLTVQAVPSRSFKSDHNTDDQ